MKEICPFAVPVQDGLEPRFPFCRATGQSIQARFESPTGYQKCGNCRIGDTNQYCELTGDLTKKFIDQINSKQGSKGTEN